jgi:hypothetical protein
VLGARYATRNGFCPAANDIGSHPGLQIELVERHQVGAFPQTGEARTQDKCMASPGRPTVDRGPRKLAPDFVADAATARDMSDDVVKMTTKVTNSIIAPVIETEANATHSGAAVVLCTAVNSPVKSSCRNLGMSRRQGSQGRCDPLFSRSSQ